MEMWMGVWCAGLSAACFAVALSRSRERGRLLKEGGIASASSAAMRVVETMLHPLRGMAAKLMRLFPPRMRARMERLPAQAGVDDRWDGAALCALQMVAALLGMCWAAAVFPGPMLLRLLVGGAAGFAAPMLWISGRARRRRQAIERGLPNALDWLALSVEAGEGFAQALSRIARRLSPGPLRETLSRLDAEMRMGIPRREALAAMARRAGVPALSSFAALLIQADALGSSVGPILQGVSRRLRRERFARAERAGIAAAQQALAPLIICIMPATFVVVFGPLIARVAAGGIAALME